METVAPAHLASLEKKAPSPSTLATVEQFDRLPESAFLRLPAVCHLFGIAPATVWRWAKSGKLPAPDKLGEHVAAWQVGKLRAAQAKFLTPID